MTKHIITLTFVDGTMIIEDISHLEDKHHDCKFRVTTLNVHGQPVDIVETPHSHFFTNNCLDLSEMTQEYREVK